MDSCFCEFWANGRQLRANWPPMGPPMGTLRCPLVTSRVGFWTSGLGYWTDGLVRRVKIEQFCRLKCQLMPNFVEN